MKVLLCNFLYQYIYIYIYILIYDLPAFTVTKKKKKTRQNSEITIYLESLPGEKRKRLSGEKKKVKANLVTTIEKNQEIRNQLVKRTKTHRKMLQCYNYKECSIRGRANYKN